LIYFNFKKPILLIQRFKTTQGVLMQSNKSLTDKLEHYSTTSRGQGVRGKSAAEWAGYAAAAGASLAMAGAADASIIYSGVRNITAQIDPSVQVPAADFQVASSIQFNVDGSSFDAFAIERAIFINANSVKYLGGGVIQVASGGSGGARFLNDGAFLSASQLIGPTGSFSANGVGQLRIAVHSASGATVNGGLFGHAPLGVTGVVGVKLGSGNFGWIRLKVEDLGLNQPFRDHLALTGGAPISGQGFGDKITVIDWAYENSGAAIHAGATGSPVGVPEPSALALLAAGAAGIGAFRRRKAERTVH
jgi:hypothetical protein